jgi:TatD DNase family protein
MFDTHCHLNDPAFSDDYREIIERFSSDGLSGALCVGYNLISSVRGSELTREFPDLISFCPGIHPNYASKAEKGALKELELLLKMTGCRAIGETGLDYYYKETDKPVQASMFHGHLDLAEQFRLPLVVHVRDAWEDVFKILTERRASVRAGGIIHCYSGSYESALRFVDMGYHIAFGGAITYKNNVTSGGIIEKLPLDRILTETDCPYLSPQEVHGKETRGKRNEPSYMTAVVKKIAELKGMPYKEVDRITAENARKLLGY